MNGYIPVETDLHAVAERNQICGRYLKQIALAGEGRKKLICELAEELLDSIARWRIDLVRTLGDVEIFYGELQGYFERCVIPHLPPNMLDEDECKARDLAIEGCARKWLGRAFEKVKGPSSLDTVGDVETSQETETSATGSKQVACTSIELNP